MFSVLKGGRLGDELRFLSIFFFLHITLYHLQASSKKVLRNRLKLLPVLKAAAGERVIVNIILRVMARY